MDCRSRRTAYAPLAIPSGACGHGGSGVSTHATSSRSIHITADLIEALNTSKQEKKAQILFHRKLNKLELYLSFWGTFPEVLYRSFSITVTVVQGDLACDTSWVVGNPLGTGFQQKIKKTCRGYRITIPPYL